MQGFAYEKVQNKKYESRQQTQENYKIKQAKNKNKICKHNWRKSHKQ